MKLSLSLSTESTEYLQRVMSHLHQQIYVVFTDILCYVRQQREHSHISSNY